MTDMDVNSMYTYTDLLAEFPKQEWVWGYNPMRDRWETYRQPSDWPPGLFEWLYRTFGHPLDAESNAWGEWDFCGGWIYIYREDYLSLFLLRWS
jgi:hypothetical protein